MKDVNFVNHKHRETALHSPHQQAMFYAVATELGYTTHEIKERAKAHFKKECFNDLTTSEMIYLIDQLVKKQNAKKEERVTRFCRRCNTNEMDIPGLPCASCRMGLLRTQAQLRSR